MKVKNKEDELRQIADNITIQIKLIKAKIEETVPLAAIMREQIETLKYWAIQSGARTASLDIKLNEELKKYS